MIDYKYKELFYSGSAKKELFFDFGEFQITNNRLYAEAFELYESLCSQNELKFGCCESSELKFKCRNEFGELKDKRFEASIVIDEKSDEPFKIGSYKVFSSEPSGDKLYTNITAYDAMYDVINAEMVEWYDALAFPMTIFEFRNSFFEYFGLNQVERELVNDDFIIEKTIDADSISGKEIITAICELNGVFGRINRDGLFDYVSLAKRKQIVYPGMDGVYPGSGVYPGKMVNNFEEAVLPSVNLYPSTDLIPSSDSFRYYEHEILPPSRYSTCEYSDFETKLISKLQIRQEENDIGVIYGDGDNTYIIQDNFLVYGKSSNELLSVARKLFAKINGIFYRPCKVKLQGNPCIEVGDIAVIHTRYQEVETYILERKIKGIQALKDSFETKGALEYEEKVNSYNKQVKKLKGKTNKLERTVEMLNSEINDEENGLKTQINQTSKEISTKVSKGEVVSEINQSAEEVKIKGEKISLEGTVTANEYFKVLKDGSIQAVNGNFEGKLKSDSAEITGGYIYLRTSSASYIQCGDATLMSNSLRINRKDLGYDSLLSYSGINMQQYGTDYFDVVPMGTTISGFLTVRGTKSRLATTKSYNERLLYCYEMPSPIFGDIGHGVIGEDGLCYVDIDAIFFETVDTNQSYQVFLQSYSENSVYVLEKTPQYFVVKGTPNTEFDWEIKAKQLDFPIERLEESISEEKHEEVDYILEADSYLDEYEQEVLNYEQY